jgi:twitching motility two-component system response regulator PilH
MSLEKILVVDDSTTDRVNLQNILSDAGYTVITAGSGAEALEKADGEKPDLIFMDVVMPQMDGYQACREITHNESTRDIPVIFVISKGQKADHMWAQTPNGPDPIKKPYIPEQIIEILNQFK